VHRPVLRLRGDHVEMAVQDEAAAGAVLTRDRDEHAGATGRGLDHRRLEPHLAKQGHHVLRGLALALAPGGGVVAAEVGGVDADQLAGEAQRLVLQDGELISGGGGDRHAGVLLGDRLSPKYATGPAPRGRVTPRYAVLADTRD